MVRHLLILITLCASGSLLAQLADFKVQRYECSDGPCNNQFARMAYHPAIDELFIVASDEDPAFTLTMKNGLIRTHKGHGLNLSDIEIGSLVAGVDSSFFYSSPLQGIFKFKHGEVEEIKVPYSPIFNQYVADLAYHNETLFIGHTWSYGLYSMDDVGTVIDFAVTSTIQDLHFDASGGFWIATQPELFYVNSVKYQNNNKSTIDISTFGNAYAYKLADDKMGHLWAAFRTTEGFTGLGEYNGMNWKIIKDPQGPDGSHEIVAMSSGNSGEVYVATRNDEVTRLFLYRRSSNEWLDLTEKDNALGSINDLLYKGNQLYAATNNGLVVLTDESQATPVKRNLLDAFVDVFPNPFSEQFQVRLSRHLVPSASYRIFNNQGQLILENPVNSDISTISLSGFPAGVYHFEIYTAEGTSRRKLMKQ